MADCAYLGLAPLDVCIVWRTEFSAVLRGSDGVGVLRHDSSFSRPFHLAE